VSWCVGHLVELADVKAYDERFARWRLADLPILPDDWKFAASDGKKKQLDILRKLLSDKSVESVVCATDAGREGELIFRLVYDYCKCKKPVERLWISSMEDAAIRDGFKKLRPGADYDNLYRAALCRAKADYLVGINATRLFSCLYGVTLNVGRVQSPTLAMVVDREAEIAAFVVQPFYTSEIQAGTFTASGERLADPQAAETIRAVCDGKSAAVRSVKREKKTAAAPALYDLTTLQREANRIFGFTAQQTLDYTQSLYEKKLCTYPRTDSRFLTSDMEPGLAALVQVVAAVLPFTPGPEVPVHAAQVIDDGKVSDHHAIIPTPSMPKADLSSLPVGERDVLTMIAARLICAVGDKHSFETVTAILECEGRRFTAKGRTVLADGWKTVERAFHASLKQQPEDDSANDDANVLPELAEGQVFPLVAASVREGKTSPPKRFTEDLLLAAMESAGAKDMPEDAERKGLGTPATRAGIIERLVKTGVIERKKKQLLPAEKGVNLIAILPDSVKSPKLTAEWEHMLGRIERGELDDKVFMTDIAAMTLSLVKDHSTPDKEHAALFTTAPEGDAVGVCPRCGEGVIERPKGFFCSSRACKFALWKDNRFFAAKRKTITKTIAAALLKEGCVFFSDLYSERTGKTYAAAIVLEDTGDQVNFRLDFEKGDKK
jgi:DNA topoisomerase-3